MTDQNHRTIDSYNRAFEKYLATMRPAPAEHVKAWLDKAIDGLNKDSKILELGSGVVTEADYLESLGYKVIRSDIVDGFIDFIKAQGHDCLKLNALTDDLPTDCDLIFANAVFLHFTNSQAKIFLDNCYKSIKTGGLLAITTKKGEDDYWQMNKLDLPRYENYWQVDDLENLVAGHGFKVLNIDEADEVFASNYKLKTSWLNLIARRPG